MGRILFQKFLCICTEKFRKETGIVEGTSWVLRLGASRLGWKHGSSDHCVQIFACYSKNCASVPDDVSLPMRFFNNSVYTPGGPLQP